MARSCGAYCSRATTLESSSSNKLRGRSLARITAPVSISTGSASVSSTTAHISGVSDVSAGWCYAGPLLGPSPSAVQDAEPPLVYVAFGTYFNTNAAIFKLVIAALADEPVEVVVSTGRRKVTATELEPLPSNVHLYDFVASREVLARARVHVTHAGCSSVHESLLAGVPMLCIPQGADNRAWCHRVEMLGVGETVEPYPVAIRAAVRRLLEDEETHSRTRAVGRQLERYDGQAEVASLEMAVADGEACGVRSELFVFGKRHLDPLDAGDVGALADKVAKRDDLAEAGVESFEFFVDLPKDHLLGGDLQLAPFALIIGSVRGLIHHTPGNHQQGEPAHSSLRLYLARFG